MLIMTAGGLQAAQELQLRAGDTQAAEPRLPAETVDVFDVWRAFRQKQADSVAEEWDYRKSMKAFAPVIGAKPSAGVLLGVAGNIAFYRGEPSTTHISSVVASITVSTEGQTAVTDRFTMFANGDRWRLDGDQRFQWTSQETHGLGTSADTRAGVQADFDFFRLHHTAYYRLRPGLFVGGGLYFDNHTDVGPAEGEEASWDESPYVQYSEAHGLPLESQIIGGYESGCALGHSGQLHQRRPRLARESQLSHVVRRVSRGGFQLAEGQPGRENLRARLARRPPQAGLLGVGRSRRRGSGAVPGPASDGSGHLRSHSSWIQ